MNIRGKAALVLTAAVVAGVPDITMLDRLQAGDSLHPEALRFDWKGVRYRARLIDGTAYAETVHGTSGGILSSGPDAKRMERYLEKGLRKLAAS